MFRFALLIERRPNGFGRITKREFINLCIFNIALYIASYEGECHACYARRELLMRVR